MCEKCGNDECKGCGESNGCKCKESEDKSECCK